MMTAQAGNLSAKTVWGKVVLFLKEHKQIALHVACGDITDVKMEGGKFYINVLEGMLINLLEEGRREIEKALRWQGLDMELVIVVKETEVSKAEKDIRRLKEVFEDVEVIKKKYKMIWR